MILGDEICSVDLSPLLHTSKISDFLAWRFKEGPAIGKISQSIMGQFESIDCVDLIWIDKAAFIAKDAMKFLRQKASHLLHFTPDPAFVYHKSRHFLSSVGLYDTLVTTKRYELDHYNQFKSEGASVILVPQGIDLNVHRDSCAFDDKKVAISFIGHAEPSRIRLLNYLLNQGIPIYLAGRGWQSCVSRNKRYLNKTLFYAGEGIYGSAYGEFLSSCLFSLGLVSDLAPDLTTTRTLEIPACGSAIFLPRNEESVSLFSEDEAFFYSGQEDIVTQYFESLADMSALKQKICKAKERVQRDFTYESILRNILKQCVPWEVCK